MREHKINPATTTFVPKVKYHVQIELLSSLDLLSRFEIIFAVR